MNLWVIKSRVDKLMRKSHITDEEEYELIECLNYLIDETKEYRYAEFLGGIYYGRKMYDLALKYYEMAETLGSKWAWNGLGYIWYYGRTGETDYEKAFKYFSKMVEDNESDNAYDKIEAQFKLADMYKNGYYVQKDFDKYVEIIESLYESVKDEFYMPRVEVFTRLASIRTSQGKTEEAVELYLTAKNDLIGRLANNRFFGDLNRMKWLTNDLYKLIEFDRTDFDLYDLYYLLNEEHTVSFEYDEVVHEIESKQSEEMNIRLDDKWFRNIDEFFINAVVDEESIEAINWWIEDWRILR